MERMTQENEGRRPPLLRVLTEGLRQRIPELGHDKRNGWANPLWNLTANGVPRGGQAGNPDWLVELLAQPKMRPGIMATSYDTAWLASVPIPSNGGTQRSCFPNALQWLESRQWPDGSWGGAVRYEHDRIVSTLAALVPLATFNQDGAYNTTVAKGTRYLWQRGHLLPTEPTELVAFELLLPTLVKRAQDMGIQVPPHLDIYRAERAEKLRLIPTGALYSPRVTLVHSLEFLGEQAELSGLYAAQGTNGAIGNSPAATAFFYGLSRDDRALAYLEDHLSTIGDAQVPVLHPCETYELLWSAYHLYLAGLPVNRLLGRQDREYLQRALQSGGVSLSPTFPIPDADDTAVAMIFLHELGETCNPRLLRDFILPEGHFASFPYERHSSVGVNLHALHALLRVPGYPDVDRTVERLLDYLSNQQINGLYWLDKWHISPYYATAHALCVLSHLPAEKASRMKPLINRSREWICQTQNQDGSWGFYSQPTLEETAFALLALTAGATESLSRYEQRCCANAAAYIEVQLGQLQSTDRSLLPPLWIDKCLYTPILVVWSVVESALLAYRSMATLDNE